MPEKYLAHAAEAEKLARTARSPEEKRVHLEVAALWHELAKRKVERSRAREAGERSAVTNPPVTPETKFEVNEQKRLVLLTLVGNVDGRSVADLLIQNFLEQPHITPFDMIYDLTRLTSAGVGAADIDRVVAAYLAGNPDPATTSRTAILSPDPFYQRWASAMTRLFNGREHRAVTDQAEAEQFLAEARVGPTPSMPPS